MKKRITRYMMAFAMVAGLSLTAACGREATLPDQSEKTEQNMEDTGVSPEDTDKEEDVSVEDAEQSGQTKDGEQDETMTDRQGAHVVASTDAECIAEIEQLRETTPVLPAETELLAEMARCVTFSRILDDQGGIFSEMSEEKRGFLRNQIYREVMSRENALSGAIPVEDSEGRYDADKLIPMDEAEVFLRDVYGEKNFVPLEYLERVEDGYILFSCGDGEPWEIIEHMQFFEDENHFLLRGPSFYEDNGGSIAFKGYAEILFAKNPDSRYGVTLLYGRYRDEKVNVTSVETSSELPSANGKNYSGMNLVDEDYTTAWVEGVSGNGVGETITLHLEKEQLVYGVQICNGYTANYDLYNKNGLLTDVRIDFGKGKVADGSLNGYAFEGISEDYLAEYNLNKVELDEPVMTDTITITITGAKPGVKYDDICVSEIKVY